MPDFDAVLLIAFGGPNGPADVRPFLANVLRGRRVTPERIEEVAHHYDLFGGVSPITELTSRQAAGLARRLEAAGRPLPVYVGMRNWHPFLADTLARMARDGVRRTIGITMAGQSSFSSCTQYKQNVVDAQLTLVDAGLPMVQVTYVRSWYAHPLFVAAQATHVHEALARLPGALRDEAELIFTAHSIPLAMAQRCRYREQLGESARLTAARLGRARWSQVYQSRSGRPEDPWLEPDIGDYLRAQAAQGLRAAVICPIGFVCDHVEVLYDLDHEAAAIARQAGLTVSRAEAANDDPHFLDMLVDVVETTRGRNGRGAMLRIVTPESAAAALPVEAR